MPSNCCNFVIPLMAIFLVIAYTTSLQYPIVVDEYGHNDYRNYDESYTKQNQPYQKQSEPYETRNQQYETQNQQYETQNQQYEKQNQPYETQNQQYEKQNQPYEKHVQPYTRNEQPFAKYEQSYTRQEQSYSGYDQPYSKFDRPIVVNAIEKPKDKQDFSKIPGIPGVDFPLYRTVPRTSFSCAYVPFAPGMYANVETGCQAYHICHDGREGHQGASFLCPNGTIFSQREFSCDWWYNVKCAEAVALYSLNLDPEKNPYLPKKKKEEPQKNMRIVVL